MKSKKILNDTLYFYEQNFTNEKYEINRTQVINFLFESKINLKRNESLTFNYNEIQYFISFLSEFPE